MWIEKSICLILSTISQTLFIMWESICTGYISLLFFITQVCPKTSRKSQYFRGQCVQTREKRNTYTNVERPGCIHGKYWHWSTDTGNVSYYALVECIDLLESLKTCNNSSLKLHMYLFYHKTPYDFCTDSWVIRFTDCIHDGINTSIAPVIKLKSLLKGCMSNWLSVKLFSQIQITLIAI